MRLILSALILILFSVALSDALPANQQQDLCEFLRDDSRYSTDGLRYSDLGSSFSVFADNRSGIGTLLLDWNGESRVFSEAPLKMDVTQTVDGIQKEIIGGWTAQRYPHGMRNRLVCRGLELETFVTFVECDVMACILDVRNTGQTKVKLTPRVRGEITELKNSSRSVVFDANANMLTFKSDEPTLGRTPGAFTVYGAISAGFPARDVKMGESETALRLGWELSKVSSAAYGLEGPRFELEPGKSRRIWAVLAVTTDNKTRLEESLGKTINEMKSGIDVEKRSRDRWNAMFRRMPAPPVDEAQKKTYYRAGSLLMNNVSQAGRNFGKNRPCSTKRESCVVTPLDAAVISVGLAEIDPQLAKEQILIVTENIREDGALPAEIAASWLSPSLSFDPPFIVTAAWHAYRKSRDKKFLAEVYPPLRKYVDWWFLANDSDYDGLVELTGPDGTAYDSAEINGCLVDSMRAMASIALALQKRDEYQEWT